MHLSLIKYVLKSRLRTWIVILFTWWFWYILNFVWPVPGLKQLWNGQPFPDLMPSGYSLQYVQNLFTQYGPVGRAYYMNFLLSGDVIFPIAYSIFFGMLMWLVIKNIAISDRLKYILTLIPFFAAICDYTENILMIITLKSFPNISPFIVQVASGVTITKNMSSLVGIVIMVTFWLYQLISKYKLLRKID